LWDAAKAEERAATAARTPGEETQP
jgi:hypothetical protein